MSCASTSGRMMMMSERPKSERGSRRLNQRRWSSTAGAAGSMSALSSIRLENISRSSHRLEVAREFGVVLDLAPEPRHLHVNGPNIAAELRLLREGLARDRLAGAPRQREQECGFRLRQMDGIATAIERAAGDLQPIGAEADIGGGNRRFRHALQDVAD